MLCNIKSRPILKLGSQNSLINRCFVARCLIKMHSKVNVGMRPHSKRPKCFITVSSTDTCFSNITLKNWQVNKRMCCASPLSLVSKKVFRVIYKGLKSVIFVSSAKHRHYERMLKSSGKCFMYGKLVRHTNKVSVRFLLGDTLHEAFFTGYQEGNIIDNHS